MDEVTAQAMRGELSELREIADRIERRLMTHLAQCHPAEPQLPPDERAAP